MDRPIVYWLKCDRDKVPHRVVARNLLDLLRDLEHYMVERGPIEFMNRES